MAGEYWYRDISHEGLHKFRRIRNPDRSVMNQMAEKQIETWNEQWAKVVQRNQKSNLIEKNKEEAAERSQEAQELLLGIEEILNDSLSPSDIFKWESLFKKGIFQEPKPTIAPFQKTPPKPDQSDKTFEVNLGFLDKIIESRKKAKIETAQKKFTLAMNEWQKEANLIDNENTKNAEIHMSKTTEWELKITDFNKKQTDYNEKILIRKIAFEKKRPEAIIDFANQVISSRNLPTCFPNEWELEYVENNHILIIEYRLPAPQDMPTLKEVKFIQAKNDFKEIYISEAQAKKDYETAIYKTVFAILYSIFKADFTESILAINFNGWVKNIDRATGKEITVCIVSIQISRDDLLKINLKQVDAKVCFKNFKGVSCSTLHTITPVAPIMKLNREDSRFINSYAVADGMDNSTNLAAMDWEDFEHLIRELFEKEFVQSGGEVKVTQVSRDGGVDAVVFDPDPIKGGKIIIQAKRYTNTVGVSAVRDLYGTLLNEGASKGILVTTSDYGPDSYDFAKGKPITLLNGANLLHLLARHGHQAKIDIAEARQIATERDN